MTLPTFCLETGQLTRVYYYFLKSIIIKNFYSNCPADLIGPLVNIIVERCRTACKKNPTFGGYNYNEECNILSTKIIL